MSRSRDYQTDLLTSLQDPDEAKEYLNAALEDENPALFLIALRDVVKANGSITKLEAATKLDRENLSNIMSKTENTQFSNLLIMLKELGFKLAVEAI